MKRLLISLLIVLCASPALAQSVWDQTTTTGKVKTTSLLFANLSTTGPSVTWGSGVPSGGVDGDVYIRTTGLIYVRNSGTWKVVGGSVILDSTVHSDTATGTVVRGDLIVGNSTPAWTRLPRGGQSGQFLRMNAAATDPEWSALKLPNSAGQYGILFANYADTIADSANLTFNGSTLAVTGTGTFSVAAQSPSFSTGWAGSGWKISTAAPSSAEVDDLRVRGRLSVYELVANQIRSTNGSILVSSSCKVAAVVDHTSYVHVTCEDTEPFVANDLARAQRFTGTGTYQSNLTVVTNPGDYEGKSFDAYYDTLPPVGAVLVRLGNTTDATRQGSVYMSADDSGAPFLQIQDGVNSFASWGTAAKIKGRVGNLAGTYGIATNTYGFAFGDSANTNLIVTPTTFQFRDSTTPYLMGGKDGSGPYVQIGGDTNGMLQVRSTSLAMWANNVRYFLMEPDGGVTLQDKNSATRVSLGAYGLVLYGETTPNHQVYAQFASNTLAFVADGSIQATLGRDGSGGFLVLGNSDGTGTFTARSNGMELWANHVQMGTFNTNGIRLKDSNGTDRLILDTSGNATFTGTVTVGYARNMLANTEFINGLGNGEGNGAAWGYNYDTAPNIGVGPPTISYNYHADWKPAHSGAGYVMTTGAPAAGKWLRVWGPRLSVIPGKTYEFSFYAGVHRLADVRPYVIYYDKDGAYVTESGGSNVVVATQSTPGGTNLADYGRASAFFAVPASVQVEGVTRYPTGATLCMWINYQGGTEDNSYLFFTHMMFAEAHPGQTQPSEWGPGGVTQITGDNIKTGTITAAKIAAGTFVSTGGAAADVNAGTTTISGGKITANSITSNQITTSDLTGLTITGGTIRTSAVQQARVELTTAGLALYNDANAKVGEFKTSDASLSLTGTINATAGYFGDSSDRIAVETGGLNLGSYGAIRAGVTSYWADGNGCWMGQDSGTPKLRCGNVSGGGMSDGFFWDGTKFKTSALYITSLSTASGYNTHLCRDSTTGYVGICTNNPNGGTDPAQVTALKTEVALLRQQLSDLQAQVQALAAQVAQTRSGGQ